MRIDQAIQAARSDVERSPQNDIMKAVYLDRLASLLGQKYSASGEMEYLEESISIGRTTLEAVIEDDPEMPIFLNTLATSLCDRYRRIGTEADINEGIRLLQIAIQYQMNIKEKSTMLNNLGVQFGLRYSKTGALDDLDQAIMVTTSANDVIDPSSAEYSGQLNNLALHLGSKYLSTGELQDLEKAIALARKSVSITPSSHSDIARRLNNLGIRIYNRYTRIGAIDDLNEAIHLIRQSIAATPQESVDTPMVFNNLGCLLGNKYARTNDVSDLDESISNARIAVDATTQGHPEEATRLNNLANQLGTRFARFGDAMAIEEAVMLCRNAVSNLNDAHPDKARWSHNLALQLGKRYLKTKQILYLEEAVAILRNVVDGIPDDHPDRATCLHNLGTQLKHRFSELKDESDLELAIRATREAVGNLSSPIITRALCGGLALDLCALRSDWSQGLEIATLTIPLIPKLSARSLTNVDKQNMLSRPYGLTCNAAAMALQDKKDPSVALNFLEQGRAVLAESLEELRVDVRQLLKIHPRLGGQFIRLQEKLDGSVTRNDNVKDESRSASKKDLADWRYRAGNDFDKLVTEIREQPGFEGFLKAPTESEMKAVAEYGPIVVINISDYRCDAITVEQNSIKCLPLPNLTKEEIQKRAREDLGSLEIMEWLWDTVVHPILEFLGFKEPPSTQHTWPRVWWIPTGALTNFSLHAAGYHGKGSIDTVIDRVMSSYSSSIKAIIHGRRHSHQASTSPKPAQALLVAMEHTVGSSDLPFAEKEVAAIHGPLTEMSFEPLKLGRQKDVIVSQLPHIKIFHFAGHGNTNEKNPSRSHLILDGENGNALLTVGTLFEMNLRKHSPFLAYLSACGTGQIKQEKFLDENIHLISAFQLAGFRHVIGTLWGVVDENCVDVAKITYEKMRDEGLTDKSVCRGLHQACKNLRNDWLSTEFGKGKDYAESNTPVQGETTTITTNTTASCEASGTVQVARNMVLDEQSLGSAP